MDELQKVLRGEPAVRDGRQWLPHDRRCCHQLHRLHRVPAGHPRLLKTAMALPIMLIAMLLPFIYFFVFGGLGLGKEKAAKAEGANIL